MKNSASTDNSFRVLAGQSEEQLLNSFFILYKTARIIDENNPTFKNQTASFFEQLKNLFKLTDQIVIKVVAGRYFVNDRLVRFDDTGLSGAATVVAEWKAIGMGGVIFSSSISIEETSRFFVFISKAKPNSQNIDSLTVSLKTHSLSSVQLLAALTTGDGETAIPEEVRKQFRKAARSTFFQAMNVVEEAIVNTVSNQEINISKTKRVVHSLIDHICRDESSLIELTAIKNYDDYTYAHSTNVCVYSLTMGVRLKMDRARLSQLGFAALFHDIGKVQLPTDLIRKPDAFDENDWIQMQRHPTLGAKTILRNLKLDSHTARAARGAFEHHINNDFTGYPKLVYDQRPTTLFSKIISIVDTFDALTSGRLYLKKALEPDKVLKKMHYQMKIKFDSFLLKIFTNIVGMYPAGSLVLLSSEEIALILTNNEKEPGRPFVKIVGDKNGVLESPLWVDLSQPDQGHREVLRLIDPDRYGLDSRDFILED